MQYKHSFKYPQRMLGALSVCNTGVQRCEGGYSWGPGVRDHHLLHYVMAGKGVYQANGRTFTVEAGDLFLVRPDENIFYQADKEEPWEYCWVGFHGSDARFLLEQTDFTQETPVLRNVASEVCDQMMRIYRSRGSYPHQTAYMTGLLYQLLSVLMRERRLPVSRSEPDSVARACTYIENNFAMPIGVTDIAAHVGLSRSRLYRLFMAQLNQSPMQVLTQVRIHQACALLRRGGLSVKAVAASVGFESQLYFSRRFHEIVGQSPTQYAMAENLSGHA